ncbi:hypothetical protein BDY21DRAFT_14716 [Lineolata rhizophorae]|uniref:Uncharacterized protein n=1 Tax=Lineolata rhizophorae TaxID=578093 RepID=A0A6A6PFB2_9PEZI|nr:hypothetical protein BDY21DRAFT_14716 [Lineolata rhizophorae]
MCAYYMREPMMASESSRRAAALADLGKRHVQGSSHPIAAAPHVLPPTCKLQHFSATRAYHVPDTKMQDNLCATPFPCRPASLGRTARGAPVLRRSRTSGPFPVRAVFPGRAGPEDPRADSIPGSPKCAKNNPSWGARRFPAGISPLRPPARRKFPRIIDAATASLPPNLAAFRQARTARRHHPGVAVFCLCDFLDRAFGKLRASLFPLAQTYLGRPERSRAVALAAPGGSPRAAAASPAIFDLHRRPGPAQ